MARKLGNLLGLLSIASIVGYSFMFALVRDEFLQLFATYSILFAAFLGFMYIAKHVHQNELSIAPAWLGTWFYGNPMLGALFMVGIIFRLSLIEYTPNLSQDFFRFIWDGHMLLGGYNPYLYLPHDLVASGNISHIPNATFLHAHMGEISVNNYTNYPPLNQLFFAVAALLGGKSMLATVVWMRLIIIAFEIGIFIVGTKLLRLLDKPLWLILLYFLNPFVIVELTGNLHWEGVMAFFSLLAVYFLFRNQRLKSALFLGYGVLLKLIPLLLLPSLYKRLGFKKAAVYYTAVFTVIVLGFLPFLSDELLENYTRTIGLWFGNFEYNAGIFGALKSIGYKLTGTNIIKTAGAVLPAMTLLIIAGLALLRKNERPETMLTTIVFSFTAYLFLTMTVHPWYLLMPLLFSVFTNYRYMMVWSYTIFLSYQGYSNPNNAEYGWLLAIEYVPVYAVLVYELYAVHKLGLRMTLN
ncbi:MAG: glycosyltransferase 87 family protein [Nonlabens sp.]|nr:glycosyltransferase 87 family protein [Nonlabens sp.]